MTRSARVAPGQGSIHHPRTVSSRSHPWRSSRDERRQRRHGGPAGHQAGHGRAGARLGRGRRRGPARRRSSTSPAARWSTRTPTRWPTSSSSGGVRTTATSSTPSIDAIASLADDGVVWLLVPKSGRPGHVEPGDVTEAAPTAGLSQTSSISAAKDWSGIRLVTPKAAAAAAEARSGDDSLRRRHRARVQPSRPGQAGRLPREPAGTPAAGLLPVRLLRAVHR